MGRHGARHGAAVNANLPIVIGEVANKQFDNGDQCFYGLDGTGINNPPPTGFRYQNLLALLAQQEVGWLAWAWHKDLCEHRRMTTDGSFANLTPYGQDILNHPTYGILSGAYRAKRSGSLPGAPPGP